MFSSKSNICIQLALSLIMLRGHCISVCGKTVKGREWQMTPSKCRLQIQQDSRTHELTMVVTVCTVPGQAQEKQNLSMEMRGRWKIPLITEELLVLSWNLQHTLA